MLFEGILDKAMCLHHPLSAFGLFLPLYENIQGNYVMMAIFISEVSNPPMTLRHILRLSGFRNTKIYEVSEVSFILLYIYARLLAGTPIVYQTLICPSNHLLIKGACLGLILQSWYFGVQMFRMLMRRYREVLLRKNVGIKLNWFTPLSPA